MINGKNYRNACCHSYCYYGNGEHWRRNIYTSDFDAWTSESEANLVLIGLKLRKGETCPTSLTTSVFFVNDDENDDENDENILNYRRRD